jgi:hypothetical protein
MIDWNDPEAKLGKDAENKLLIFLRKRFLVLSARDYSGCDGTHAPMMISCDTKIILPDFMCAKDGRSWWVEAKAKTESILWRTGPYAGMNFHGIDQRQFDHYRDISVITGMRISLVVFDKSKNQFLYLEDLIGSDGVILGDGTMKKGNQRIKMINFRVAEFENLEPS